ncbi:MAG TPA: (2Fe-2S) ferredoxin domain-containing protein [Clostridia bacterium]
MKLKICVGSSCHLHGSYAVIEELSKLLKKYGVENLVEMEASFCMGQCQHSVNITADEVFLHDVNQENIEKKFLDEIYPKLRNK